MFHALYKTPLRLARIYMAYGPGQSCNKVIPRFISKLLQGEPPEIASPRRLVDWIYIDDVVEGLIAVATTAGVDGRNFELGSGQLVSIEDVAMRLRNLIDPTLTPVAARSAPQQTEVMRCADLGPTTKLTGWRPCVSLDEGLQRTIKAIRQERHLVGLMCPRK
jgi:nucleoside-diphosphate-sugar epimerase